MKIGRRAVKRALCLLFVLALAPSVRAEDAQISDPQDQTKKLNTLIEGSIDWYQVFPDAYSKTALRPQPVMRWRNVARGQAGEAMMVIWADHGRSLAFASIYPWEGHLCHEFGSLSRGNKLVARDKDTVIWAPNVAGIEFKDIPEFKDDPEASPPGDTPHARLRQMKLIAGRFKATMTGWKGDDSDREELRLLPRPLYRYDFKGVKEPPANLVDGAVFAFVMGTDPEVVMVLEVIGPSNEVRWQYAFARATSGGLEVKLEGQTIWTAEKFPANRVPTNPQVTVRRLIEE